MLDELAQQEEGHGVGDARGLLHVMGNHHECVVALELHGELLDLDRRDRVERRGGLVHKQDLGLHRDGARDAQALLLATGQAQTGLLELVLDLVPQGGAAQGILHQRIEFAAALHAGTARSVGDIVVDAHGKRIGMLEHHAHALAQQRGVVIGVNVTAVELDGTLDTAVLHVIVHTVQAAQQGRLAAAGRPDERGDLTLGNID